MSTDAAHEWIEELYEEELYRFSCHTLVVIPQAWEDIEQEDKVVLEKMLRAVKVGLAGAHIIHAPHLTTARLAQLDPRYAIVLGATMDEPIADGEVATLGNTSLVRAASLDKLDDTSKQVLWSALRKMYSL